MWLDVGRQGRSVRKATSNVLHFAGLLAYEHLNGHCIWRGLGSFIRRDCLTGWVTVTRDSDELEANSGAQVFRIGAGVLWGLSCKRTTRLWAWSKDVVLAGKVRPLTHVGRQAFSLEEVRLRMLPPLSHLIASICNGISLPRTFFSVPAPQVGLSMPPDSNLL